MEQRFYAVTKISREKGDSNVDKAYVSCTTEYGIFLLAGNEKFLDDLVFEESELKQKDNNLEKYKIVDIGGPFWANLAIRLFKKEI